MLNRQAISPVIRRLIMIYEEISSDRYVYRWFISKDL